MPVVGIDLETETGSIIKLDSRSNYASPSPVTDGQRAIFFFGNGDLVSFLMDGSESGVEISKKIMEIFAFNGLSSSPTLHNGKLYLPVLQRNEVTHGRGKNGTKSFLLCMNPSMGRRFGNTIVPRMQKKSL